MAFYEVPPTLDCEIDGLERQIRGHLAGAVDAATLKAYRVPFGIYEQRRENTYMVRVRCPGGALTPRQLGTLAALSERYGAPHLHITTRQEVQLHDIALGETVPVLRELRAEGLSSRGGGGNTVRNITASADSGVATEEVFDVSPYAFALTSRLIAEPESWNLPRKYKIAFSNSARDNAHAAFHDLGFIAKVDGGRRGFEVLLAGGLGTKPQPGAIVYPFVPDSDVYAVAAGAVRFFAANGNRRNRRAARLRFLWNSLGRERFTETLSHFVDETRRTQPPLEIRQPSAFREYYGGKRPVAPGFEEWSATFVARQPRPNLHTVLVPIFLGNLSAALARELATLLEPLGEDVIRGTMEQNLLLRNIPSTHLPELFALLGGVSKTPRFVAESTACTGADTCKLGICLSKGALHAVRDHLSSSDVSFNDLAGVRLNISGCPNSCGKHPLADLGFSGKAARKNQRLYPAYAVVAGARIGGEKPRLAVPLGEVNAHDLPLFVEQSLRAYASVKTKYASFADYVDGEGRDALTRLASRYKDVPAYEDNPAYYGDWGSNSTFSLAGRGVGECAAGIFDLIDIDRKRIERLRLEIVADSSASQRAERLRQIVLCASRMLLVVCGVEPSGEAQIFDAFLRQIVQPGYVDARFRVLVEAARDGHAEVLTEAPVDALVAAVEQLYASMGDTLKLPCKQADRRTEPERNCAF